MMLTSRVADALATSLTSSEELASALAETEDADASEEVPSGERLSTERVAPCSQLLLLLSESICFMFQFVN